MNTGQMMLTLGALMLFGIQMLNVNSGELNTTEEVNTAKFSIMATALAKSTIDNAFALKFDANTIFGNALPDNSGMPSSGSFTAANGLGCNNDEKTYGVPDAAKFNDFDDYNGYTAVVDTLPSAEYSISSIVHYVDPSKNFAVVNYCTWDKEIVVTVSSPNLDHPIVLSAINSYWKY